VHQTGSYLEVQLPLRQWVTTAQMRVRHPANERAQFFGFVTCRWQDGCRFLIETSVGRRFFGNASDKPVLACMWEVWAPRTERTIGVVQIDHGSWSWGTRILNAVELTEFRIAAVDARLHWAVEEASERWMGPQNWGSLFHAETHFAEEE